jgi:fatty-acid desaturase
MGQPRRPLPFLLWGLFFRATMGLHATWMVNSLTHLSGSRRFATRDGSRNNWFVALLSFGEGWHNNHHAYPTSARHGFAWYEIDMSWLVIRLLQTVGLAKSVRTASLPKRQPAAGKPGSLLVSVRLRASGTQTPPG